MDCSVVGGGRNDTEVEVVVFVVPLDADVALLVDIETSLFLCSI
jgi:hypothetical protein